MAVSTFGCQLENVVLARPFSIARSSRVCPLLVRLVGDEEGGVDGLHAGGAGEAPHEPVVDALGVVGVHARQVAHAVADAELDHADHASEMERHTCEETIPKLPGMCMQSDDEPRKP